MLDLRVRSCFSVTQHPNCCFPALFCLCRNAGSTLTNIKSSKSQTVTFTGHRVIDPGIVVVRRSIFFCGSFFCWKTLRLQIPCRILDSGQQIFVKLSLKALTQNSKLVKHGGLLHHSNCRASYIGNELSENLGKQCLQISKQTIQ